jgi:hypothetical protein
VSHFFGTVVGGRGEATRCGHASTGLRVSAQSYTGSIQIHLTCRDGVDWYHITVCRGSSRQGERDVLSGKLSDLINRPPCFEFEESIRQLVFGGAHETP